jgi:hypothetical protein
VSNAFASHGRDSKAVPSAPSRLYLPYGKAFDDAIKTIAQTNDIAYGSGQKNQ